MSDTLMTVIGIFLAVMLMFIFPLMEIGGKSDEISQTVVEVAVSDFVSKVSNQGKITSFDYDALVQKLSTTGNTYDIQIEAKLLDDNSKRTTAAGSYTLLGETKYYSVYTNVILDEIRENDEYILKKDDYIVVTIENTNITFGSQLKNFLYKLVGDDTSVIKTSESSLVANTGEKNIKLGKIEIPVRPEPEPEPDPEPVKQYCSGGSECYTTWCVKYEEIGPSYYCEHIEEECRRMWRNWIRSLQWNC